MITVDSPDLFGPALGTLVRATALLAGALLLAVPLARCSARARHAFWTMITVALLTLPWLPAALPSLPVPGWHTASGSSQPMTPSDTESISTGGATPRANTTTPMREPAGLGGSSEAPWSAESSVRMNESLHERSASNARSSDAVEQVASGSGGPAAMSSEILLQRSTIEIARGEEAGPRQANILARSDPRRGFFSPLARAAFLKLPLLLLWAMGTALVLGALGLGLLRLRRLARGAQRLDEATWGSFVERARRKVGLRRFVDVRSTPEVPMPLAAGIWRPFVLLPESAASWSSERQQLVLLHELVHVARHDALRQLLSRVSVAVYWFHPLARIAARQAVLAREQACDEAVVALGHRPSLYARHLLELSDEPDARSLPAPALLFLERRQLEKRLMAILGPTRRPRRGAATAGACAAMIWALTVAAATPSESQVPPPPPPPPSPPAPVMPQDAPPAPPPPPAPSAVRVPGIPPAPPAPAQPLTAPRPPVSALAPEAPPPAPVPAAVGVAPAPPVPPVPAQPAWAPPPPPPAPPAPVAPPPPPPLPPPPPPQELACRMDDPITALTGVGSFGRRVDGGRVTWSWRFVNGDRVVQTEEPGLTACMRTHGGMAFGPDGSLASMPPGSWIVLSSRNSITQVSLPDRPTSVADMVATLPAREIVLTVTAGNDGPQYVWRVDGVTRPFEAEGMEWRDALLDLFDDGIELQVGRLVDEAERARVNERDAMLAELQLSRSERQSSIASELAADLVSRRAQIEAMRATATVSDSVRRQLRDLTAEQLVTIRREMEELDRQLSMVRSAADTARVGLERTRELTLLRRDVIRTLAPRVRNPQRPEELEALLRRFQEALRRIP